MLRGPERLRPINQTPPAGWDKWNQAKIGFVLACSQKLGRACTEDDVYLVDMVNRITHRLSSLYVTCDARQTGDSGLAVHAGPLEDPDYRECPKCSSNLKSNDGEAP